MRRSKVSTEARSIRCRLSIVAKPTIGPSRNGCGRWRSGTRGEPSVAATLLLNYVMLEPGQALHLEAGNLHAYLHGAGIELMGASDNVVRGGLTIKPVDVDELLRVVDRTPLDEPVLPTASHYDLPGAHVTLRRLEPGAHHRAIGHELAVDMNGGTWYYAPGDHVEIDSVTYVVVPFFNTTVTKLTLCAPSATDY